MACLTAAAVFTCAHFNIQPDMFSQKESVYKSRPLSVSEYAMVARAVFSGIIPMPAEHYTEMIKSAEDNCLIFKSSSRSEEDFKTVRDNLAEFISITYRGSKPDEVVVIVKETFEIARRKDLDPLLLLALMAAESSFRPKTLSSTGDYGLMQVNVAVHKEKFLPFGGRSAAMQIKPNIEVDSSIIGHYIHRSSGIDRALQRYVGSANSPTDRGYGVKVLNIRRGLENAAVGNFRQASRIIRYARSMTLEDRQNYEPRFDRCFGLEAVAEKRSLFLPQVEEN